MPPNICSFQAGGPFFLAEASIPEEIQQLCGDCRGRQRDRDALLVLVLFQTGLRISEALGLTVGQNIPTPQACRPGATIADL
jgi:site-specific recombinase XerD